MHVEKKVTDAILEVKDYNGVYVNRTPIVNVGGVPLFMHEVALAGILARLNMVFIGRSGPGKSQLIADITNGLFNGEAVHLRGSTDLKVRPVYCSVDIELLKKGKFDEAVKPRKNAQKMLHIMEEFNRTPPVIQNDWLAVADGVLDIDGTQIPIQGQGYSIAIGAANVGNGEFSGTFQTDNALKERLVLALDFDGLNKPREMDYFDIFEASSDPRVVASEKKDRKDQITRLHREVRKIASEADYLLRMMQIYLVKGLDEVEIGNRTYSKEEIPNLGAVVAGDSKASKDILNYMMPPSVRAAKVFGSLAPALAVIAMAKGADSDAALADGCSSALQLILPFSDSLPKKVISDNKGSRRLAATAIAEKIGAEMPTTELLVEGLRRAGEGELSDVQLKGFEKPRVRCISRFLRSLNEDSIREKAKQRR